MSDADPPAATPPDATARIGNPPVIDLRPRRNDRTTPRDVIAAIRLILGREPESEAEVLKLMRFPTIGELGRALIRSQPGRRRHGLGDRPARAVNNETGAAGGAAASATTTAGDPDDEAASDTASEAASEAGGAAPADPAGELPAADRARLRAFAADSPMPQPGFVTDFLGVVTRTELAPAFAALDGTALGIPYAGDVFGPVEAWLGLLDAVAASKDRCRLLALGAFWGCWPIAGHAAAHHHGLPRIRLYAVEADPARCDLIRRHMRDNRIMPMQHVVVNAAVTVAPGTVIWPLQPDPLAPEERRPLSRAEAVGRPTVPLPALALADILTREAEWDFVRMDLGSTEPALLDSAIDVVNGRVRRLVIGTRSRVAEAALIVSLANAGWQLERERPCRMAWRADAKALEQMTVTDGVQVWRNPLLV